MVSKTHAIFLLFLFSTGNLHANQLNASKMDDKSLSDTAEKNQSQYRRNLDFLYSYTDFKFNSTTGASFNRFNGFANQYGLGGRQYFISNRLLTGLYVYRIDTKVNSQLLLSPNPLSYTNQEIKNHTVLGYVNKFFNSNFSMGLAGAYGYNDLNNQLITSPGTSDQQIASARTNNYNWFTTLSAAYYKPVKHFLLQAGARLLYSEVHTRSYAYRIQNMPLSLPVERLTNRLLWVMEDAELDYTANEHVKPFVTGGLIQVAKNRNSRALITSPVVGSLPQLSITKNGYRVGGGIMLKHNKWSLRLEHKYYNASNLYVSNQTLLSISYAMS